MAVVDPVGVVGAREVAAAGGDGGAECLAGGETGLDVPGGVGCGEVAHRPVGADVVSNTRIKALGRLVTSLGFEMRALSTTMREAWRRAPEMAGKVGSE